MGFGVAGFVWGWVFVGVLGDSGVRGGVTGSERFFWCGEGGSDWVWVCGWERVALDDDEGMDLEGLWGAEG
ncbi:hypothetical protein Tdes44962_MAKER09176 [Teratosphaeria destructans]|uniref:Uncharacterized protein n=1 Tax=Teratosphaeria destructans TaxID=418781 RepID=A0A9W7STT6_9PEZI|nr:hypothetical protein Tdes44962_MAKER09176 [Teratosphaeria destructans]